MQREELDPDDVCVTSAEVFWPTGGGGRGDALRPFSAAVVVEGPEPEQIGTVAGYVGWRIDDIDIWDAADHVSTDIERLGVAAREINEQADPLMRQALFVESMTIYPQFRGNKIWRAVVNDLFDIFYLDPARTIVVTQPEPMSPEGAHRPDGPERDVALAKLQDACRAAGLEPWGDGTVWWLPPEDDDAGF